MTSQIKWNPNFEREENPKKMLVELMVSCRFSLKPIDWSVGSHTPGYGISQVSKCYDQGQTDKTTT